MTIRSNHRAATSILVASLTLLTACASSPLERRQVVLYSEAEMAARGAAAYSQMREETSLRMLDRLFDGETRNKWWMSFSKRKFLDRQLGS